MMPLSVPCKILFMAHFSAQSPTMATRALGMCLWFHLLILATFPWPGTHYSRQYRGSSEQNKDPSTFGAYMLVVAERLT